MDNEDLGQIWRQRIEDLAQSGMSVRQWLEQNGYSKGQYHYWRRRLAEDDTQQTHRAGWLPVSMAPAASIPPSGLCVCIAGASIEVAPGFDPALLRAIVVALGQPEC